jgi:predicted acylesterase/phospholipase RssA
MRKFMLLLVCGLALSGCATRGAVKFTCRDFDEHIHTLPQSQLERDIHRDALAWPGGEVALHASTAAVEEDIAERDPMAAAMAELADSAGPERPGAERFAPAARRAARPVLLLSGGGQWGAYGAGLLDRMHEQGGPAATDFGVITGVSTGGVQSLFVAINSAEAYDALIEAYSPASEKDVVNRPRRRELAALTGALAGLAPLRKRIEAALCKDGKPALGCPLIEQLAAAHRPVYIGFIRASTGDFLYADAAAIAQGVHDDPLEAQQCLTGVALASAAMPAFYQQVKINGQTYFDGGVRKSVFVANVASLLEQAVARARLETKGEAATPELYVIRNGPAELLGPNGEPEPDPRSDGTLNALDAALRAEAIVVNELEVGSIAALRLSYPSGGIFLTTADGYDRWQRTDGAAGCTKPANVMFDPAFMACLRDLGRYKADRPAPWIRLSEISSRKHQGHQRQGPASGE